LFPTSLAKQIQLINSTPKKGGVERCFVKHLKMYSRNSRFNFCGAAPWWDRWSRVSGAVPNRP